MNIKRKTIVWVACSILMVCAVGRVAWIKSTAISIEESAPSHDGKNVAKISSEWSECFWTGAPRETHDIRIETKDGHLVRRVLTEEPWTGWPKDSIIIWTPDSVSVAVTFKVEEALSTQLVLKAIR